MLMGRRERGEGRLGLEVAAGEPPSCMGSICSFFLKAGLVGACPVNASCMVGSLQLPDLIFKARGPDASSMHRVLSSPQSLLCLAKTRRSCPKRASK